MQKEPYTLKDPTTVLEIDGMRYGAGSLTKEKIIALVSRDSAYAQYFHFPQAEKPKKEKKEKPKDKEK